jgi:hypothetical protein
VEPAFGWLFVLGVIAALAMVILAAGRPIVKVPGDLQVHQIR